jgi:predicted glycosyltransferase
MVKNTSNVGSRKRPKVWIDLDNSPHVPFFVPIIEELKRCGSGVLLTGRDCSQVRELVGLFNLPCKIVGRHHGKNKFFKVLGTCDRALRLAALVARERPDLAVSHCSRAQLLTAWLLRIPSLLIFDYEFIQRMGFIVPTRVMVPEVIPNHVVGFKPDRVSKYPGIKEDVYVSRFKPDATIKSRLGLNGQDLVVTIRPPANEAHYHNPESDTLFDAVVDFLSCQPNTKMVLLPRNEKQRESARERWAKLFVADKIIVPGHVVDGLNLIWHSDLVISGGGTMNREAAALGVPVYSTFRGKIGAVDQYLAKQGRLTLIENTAEIPTKLVLASRNRPTKAETGNCPALQTIVDNILAILNVKRLAARH